MTLDLATQRGVVTYGTGKFGTALTAGVLSATDTAFSTAVGTAECWVQTTSSNTIVALGTTADLWWLGSSAGKAGFGYPGSASATASAVTINDGAWHHLALTYDGTNVKLWVDGALANTTAYAAGTWHWGNSGATYVAVGGFGSNTGFDWLGTIDEARWSSTVRYTSAFSAPTAAFVKDANTVALYHLDGNGTNDTVTTNIAATDANIVYSPYTWAVGGGVAKTINSGAYFRTLIQGSPTSIALNFDLAGIGTPLPQVAVTVDGISRFTGAVAASVTVPIPAGPSWGKHLVEVVVKSTTDTQTRWATQASAVKFLGLTTAPTSCTTAATQSRPLRGLIYGDSITEGFRTLAQANPNDTDNNDATLSWAYRLGEQIGAEVGVVGFNASGLTVGGNGGVPALTSTYNLLWSGQARSFTPAPDFIVLLEGTNDGATNTVSAATTVLNALLAATPAATKIFVLRPLNGTSQAANLQAAVAACTTPTRVTYVDTAGWFSTADATDGNLHPTGYANLTSIAPRAAAAVRTALGTGGSASSGGSGRYVNVGGTAKLVGTVVKA